jgi:uncharacterized protein YcbK (DUF882 family)
MDNLEKIKRHLGKDIPITLINSEGQEDEFLFKPLNIEQQVILMEISKRIDKRDKIKFEDKDIVDVKQEDIKELTALIKDIVKTSMPGIDEETLDNFVMSNFDQLSEKMVDLIPKNQNSDALNKIKKKQQELRNVK